MENEVENRFDNEDIEIKTCLLGGFDKKDVIRYIEELISNHDAEKEKIFRREQVLSSMLLEAKMKSDDMVKYATDLSEKIINDANLEAEKIINDALLKQKEIIEENKKQMLDYADRLKNMKLYILNTQKTYKEACQRTSDFLDNALESLEVKLYEQ